MVGVQNATVTFFFAFQFLKKCKILSARALSQSECAVTVRSAHLNRVRGITKDTTVKNCRPVHKIL